MHFNAAHTVLRNSKNTTYADDRVIFVSGSSIDEIEGELNNDLGHLKAWFDENELLINLKKGKTESMIFGTAKRLGKTEKKEMKVEVNGTSIAGTLSYKYLGVHLDQSLNFATHFDKIYKKATGRLNLHRRIRSSIDSASAEKIYHTRGGSRHSQHSQLRMSDFPSLIIPIIMLKVMNELRFKTQDKHIFIYYVFKVSISTPSLYSIYFTPKHF